MLRVKRLVTSAILFVVLFIVFLVLAVGVGSAVVAGRAVAKETRAGNGSMSSERGGQLGQAAAKEFARRYGSLIMLGAFGLSALGAVSLPFSGALPWCRMGREES